MLEIFFYHQSKAKFLLVENSWLPSYSQSKLWQEFGVTYACVELTNRDLIVVLDWKLQVSMLSEIHVIYLTNFGPLGPSLEKIFEL